MENGLSNTDVRCIFEDSRGLIWIGTTDGLNRYDANGIRVFKTSLIDTNTIVGSYINVIKENKNGLLWIGTSNSFCLFNPYNNKSQNFKYDAGNKNGPASPWISDLHIFPNENILITTNQGLQEFDVKNKKFITYQYAKPEADAQMNSFGKIAADHNGNIWTCNNYGLVLIDAKTKSLTLFPQPTAVSITGIFAIGDELFFTTWGKGFWRFDLESKTYSQVLQAHNNNKSNTIISALKEWKDNNGNVWLCVGEAGFFTLRNKTNGNFKTYTYNKYNPNSYNLNLPQSITVDRQNRLWIGADNGLQVIDPSHQNFENIYLYNQAGIDNPEHFGAVNCLTSLPEGYLLSSWYGRGLYKADTNWNIIPFTFKGKIVENPLHKTINSIYVEKNGTQWFGTDSGLIQNKNANFKHFGVPNFLKPVPNEFLISDIIEKNGTSFWLRIRTVGIGIFDKQLQAFTRIYPLNKKGLNGYWCSTLAKDRWGDIWAGTDSAMYYFDEKLDSFLYIKRTNSLGRHIPIHRPRGISSSKDGKNIWVACNSGGILKIDRKTKTAFQYAEKDGAGGTYYKLKVDTAGIVWISSSIGLVRYDPVKNQFKTQTFENGLPKIFNYWGFLEFDKKGQLLLSNSGIISRFNPYNFYQNTYIPDVILTDVSANNRAVEAKDSLLFTPGTSSINFQFSINSFTAAQTNQYFYKMGGSDGWHPAQKGNILFGTFSPGDYELFLKGISSDGVESRTKRIQFSIQPYWYQTIWFKMLALTLALGLAVFLVSQRIKNIRHQSHLKLKMQDTEMRALRSQMNPHFIFNCLNSIGLYTAQNNSEAAGYYLSKFGRLIRLVLQNSKSDVISLAQELETLSLYLDLEKMRFKDKLNYSISLAENIEADYLEIPPMLIQPFVENAVWHGIMHKEDGGTIGMHFSLNDAENMLIVTIDDNGIGRKKAEKLKSKSDTSHKSYGMKITEGRMDLINEIHNMNTSVQVDDLYDELGNAAGTKVTIRIPV